MKLKEDKKIDSNNSLIKEDNNIFFEGNLPDIFVADENEWKREHYVVGYYENEECISALPDRSEYNNWEVNENLWNYFRFLGKKDMDIVYLCFLLKKKQEEVMTILKKTQPAVSYDVTRIKSQMDFIAKLNMSIDDFIEFIVDTNNGLNTYDKEMLVVFFYTTSIVKTARLLKLKNVTCRSHINTIINHLYQMGNNDMYVLFKYIMNNLNSVKKYVKKNDYK